jgi:hypothetical protein
MAMREREILEEKRAYQSGRYANEERKEGSAVVSLSLRPARDARAHTPLSICTSPFERESRRSRPRGRWEEKEIDKPARNKVNTSSKPHTEEENVRDSLPRGLDVVQYPGDLGRVGVEDSIERVDGVLDEASEVVSLVAGDTAGEGGSGVLGGGDGCKGWT